jgi:hypothetical protein
MRSLGRSDVLGWSGFAGTAGGLVSVLMLAGCPGTLDLSEFPTGSGGTNATGGSGSGGSTGTGGASADCTGNNDGATIVTMQCAVSGCHDSASAQFSASLDLTVNSTIGSRLVGVMAAQPAGINMASCSSEQEPLLKANTSPAMGLLVDKIGPNFPCGGQMPLDSLPLSTTQQNCLIQWATTLTSP